MQLNNGEQFKFVVDEKKRTVVAILEVPSDVMVNELRNIIHKETKDDLMVRCSGVSKKCYIQDKYVGKSVCHPDDEWDMEKGKEIARLRALKKYMQERKRVTGFFEDVFDGIEDRLEKAKKFAKYSIKHMDDAIEKISKEMEEKEETEDITNKNDEDVKEKEEKTETKEDKENKED